MPRDVLVTAGATRNPVDAIRYLSAHATGTTGTTLALALAVDHPVHLLGSAEALLRAELALARHPAPPRLTREEYTGTRNLEARVARWATTHPAGVLLHSAAVGDYELADATTTKIPSGQAEIVLRLTPAPKILDQIRGWAPDAVIVSFKAGRPGLTPEELEAIARAQLHRSRSDLVFANVIGATESSVLLVGPTTTESFAHRGDALDRLLQWVRAVG